MLRDAKRTKGDQPATLDLAPTSMNVLAIRSGMPPAWGGAHPQPQRPSVGQSARSHFARSKSPALRPGTASLEAHDHHPRHLTGQPKWCCVALLDIKDIPGCTSPEPSKHERPVRLFKVPPVSWQVVEHRIEVYLDVARDRRAELAASRARYLFEELASHLSRALLRECEERPQLEVDVLEAQVHDPPWSIIRVDQRLERRCPPQVINFGTRRG